MPLGGGERQRVYSLVALRDVAEDQDDAHHVMALAHDRGGAVVNGNLVTIPRDYHAPSFSLTPAGRAGRDGCAHRAEH
jgi:hypothetical protein